MIKAIILPALALVFLIGITLISYLNLQPGTAHAQCVTSDLNEGLISAESTSGVAIGNKDGTCVIDPETNKGAYRDFNVPSYEELKNQFYTLSTSGAKQSSPKENGALVFNGDGIYKQTAAMNISSAIGNGVQIIFVDSNLYITGNINYADSDPSSGIVFVVSQNIYIDYQVQKVNAVLISFGKICTASQGDTCLTSTSGTFTPQLTINGGLISLNKVDIASGGTAIILGRNLTVNDRPAEVINKQSKYLYILKNGLFTKDLVLTQEDKNYNIIPDPGGAPVPPPSVETCQGTNPLVINTSPDFKDVNTCVIGI